jgi:hydrogenase maturation protease
MTTQRILVAGVGNVFLGDDGFGVAVAQQLAGRPQPAGVEVADIGIGGIHLAYELLDGCALLVLVDAAPRGEAPGTLTVLEVDGDAAPTGTPTGAPTVDAHGLAPDDLFALLDQVGAAPGRTVVIGCQPEDVTPGMDLSAPVQAAVPRAVSLVEEIVRRETAQARREWSR